MNQNNPHIQIVAQWITSIAISVVCCAVLFIVFAGYIVDLKSAINLSTVRLEMLQEKYTHLTLDMENLKRALDMQAAQEPAPTAPAVPEVPPATGVQINEPAPADPDERGSIAPELNPVQPQPAPAVPAAAAKPAAPVAVPTSVKQPVPSKSSLPPVKAPVAEPAPADENPSDDQAD